MRRLIRWAFFLYPPEWRARYGHEFKVLLDDIGPSGRDFWNIVSGAMLMQTATFRFWKWAAALLAAGALAVGLAESTWPSRFQATTILRLNRLELASGVAQSLEEVRAQVTSSRKLGALITRYDLYPRDRHMSAGELAAKMRRDIKVTVIDAREGLASFGVSFSYRDAQVARRVAWDLANDVTFAREYSIPRFIARALGQKKRIVWARVRSVEPISSEPVPQNRFLYVAAFLAAGLVLWEAAVRLRPRFAMAWAGFLGRIPPPTGI